MKNVYFCNDYLQLLAQLCLTLPFFIRTTYSKHSFILMLFAYFLLSQPPPSSTRFGTAFFILRAWQQKIVISRFIATVLMYLSKPYDCLTHDLIITALEAEVLGQKNEVVLKL